MLILCMTTYTVCLLLINEYREYGNMYNYTELAALNNFHILLEIEVISEIIGNKKSCISNILILCSCCAESIETIVSSRQLVA